MNPAQPNPTPPPAEEILSIDGAFLSKYPTHVGSPKIEVPDVDLFKQQNLVKANHKFSKRAEEIREQISNLMLEYADNQMIWDSKINFEPYIGCEIYVYLKTDGHKFVSLISPSEWKEKYKCLGNFKLDTDFSWKRLNFK